jgi:hypothetical protein
MLGFNSRANSVGFVMDKVALEQVFSDYFDLPLSTVLASLHTLLSSSSLAGAGTVGPFETAVPTDSPGLHSFHLLLLLLLLYLIPGINLRADHVRFVVDEVELGQIFL